MKLQQMLNELMINTPIWNKDCVRKDGLPYCALCGGARYQEFMGSIIPSPCKCLEEKWEAEEKQAKQKKHFDDVNRLLENSQMSKSMYTAKFDTTDLARDKSFITAYQRAKKYCEIYRESKSNGYGIYFYGDTGVGKTHLMACIVNYLANKYIPSILLTESDIMQMYLATFNGKDTEANITNKLVNVEFLLIDDIGTQKYTRSGDDTYMQGKMFDILDKRCAAKMPTIFSSNHSISELADRGILEKTADRIAAMSTAVIKIEGDSYRIKKRKEMKENAPF